MRSIQIGVAVAFILILGGIYSWLDQPVTSDKLTIRPNPQNQKAIIYEWTGSIDIPMARLLQVEFSKTKDTYQHITLVLNSEGGAVSEGAQVIKLINNMKRTHTVKTYVGKDMLCASMCVPIFMAGENRTASAHSQWMFHQPILVNAVSGQEGFSFGNDKQLAAIDIYHQFYKNSVLNPAWAEKLKQDWQDGKEIWKTGRQLKREDANIIQKIEAELSLQISN